MTKPLFCTFKTCLEAIRLAVVLDVLFGLSLHIVEGLLRERVTDIGHETERYW